MYKYNFTYHDWFVPLHVILKKTECYVINCASTDDILDCHCCQRVICDKRDTCNISE